MADDKPKKTEKSKEPSLIESIKKKYEDAVKNGYLGSYAGNSTKVGPDYNRPKKK